MSDQPEEKEKPKAPPPVRAKTSKLIVLLLLVNIGATGYVAYQGMDQVAAVHEAATTAVTEVTKSLHHERPKDEVGPVTSLDPFIVNLNEPEATRYLKATFELEVSDADVVGELEKQKRPVRDEVLRYLSSLSVADTQGEAGKAKIQQEVVARIDKQLGGNKVHRLFFVEFVIQ